MLDRQQFALCAPYVRTKVVQVGCGFVVVAGVVVVVGVVVQMHDSDLRKEERGEGQLR